MRSIAIVTVVIAMLATVPASAEHTTFGDGSQVSRGGEASRSTDLDLQLRLGLNGFRLGGRLLGPEGVAGAWLNGGMGPSGFQLDGRVQREDGRAWNFKLDAEVMDEAGRLAWRWFRGRML
jgi:hypothetical protein